MMSASSRRFDARGGSLITRILVILLAVAVLISIITRSTPTRSPSSSGSPVRRTTDPGPHLKIPLLETVTFVPVQRQLKGRVRLHHGSSTIRSQFTPEREYAGRIADAHGDLNVASSSGSSSTR